MKVLDITKDLSSYAIEYEPDEYSMKFTIKEISGWGENPNEKGKWDIPCYGEVRTEDFEHGEEVAHGFIKWDGCSHWYFSDYQHICGWRNGKEFGNLVRRVFDLASKNISGWMDDVADYPED